MNTVEQLATRLYRRRISEAQYERFVRGNWTFERTTEKPRIRIDKLLNEGCRVTTGWMATSIRGWHTHYIVWKPKS